MPLESVKVQKSRVYGTMYAMKGMKFSDFCPILRLAGLFRHKSSSLQKILVGFFVDMSKVLNIFDLPIET